jgi:hypothetical protein
LQGVKDHGLDNAKDIPLWERIVDIIGRDELDSSQRKTPLWRKVSGCDWLTGAIYSC